MPSRKSDARKSDVTSAHFALAEDSASELLLTTPTDQPQDRSQDEKKDLEVKEKGKEKSKDKEAEKDKEHDKDGSHSVTIEELTLPKSIITRLAKGVLPPNTQIQANAILALSKSTTVFINYLASHANEHTVNANKKTIMPADVFKALEDIEFGFLKERLEAEFNKFNAVRTEKRTTYRKKVREAKTAQDATDGDVNMVDAHGDSTLPADTTLASTTSNPEAPASGPLAKKAKVDSQAQADADDAETEEDPEAGAEDDGEEEEGDDPGQEEDEEDDEVEEEEEDDEEEQGSGDETKDTLEEKIERVEEDEALDGDESD